MPLSCKTLGAAAERLASVYVVPLLGVVNCALIKLQHITNKNVNFVKILSTFPCYIVNDKSIAVYHMSINKVRKESIQTILNFVEKEKNNLNYNLKSKEGLPLLAILLIYYQHPAINKLRKIL